MDGAGGGEVGCGWRLKQRGKELRCEAADGSRTGPRKNIWRRLQLGSAAGPETSHAAADARRKSNDGGFPRRLARGEAGSARRERHRHRGKTPECGEKITRKR